MVVLSRSKIGYDRSITSSSRMKVRMKQRALCEVHAPLFSQILQVQGHGYCATVRLPTPHPTLHRAYFLDRSQNNRPRAAHDRGASLTLPASIPARIPRSLTGPDCSRCRSALSCTSAGRSTRLTALEHGALRPQACPMVCPSMCHAGAPPAASASSLSCTSAQSLPISLLTTYSRPSRIRSCGCLDG